MNIIDILILSIIAVSIIFGMYRGFINGILSVIGVILSIVISMSFSGQVADKLKDNETLVNTLIYYTDAGSRIGDLDLSTLPVSSLNENIINSILEKAGLPESFENIFIKAIRNNKENTTVSSLLSKTIVNVSISIISFLITFLIVYIIISFIIHMISYVFELPVLRHLDALIGGIIGGIRGILILYVLFALIPLIMAIIPIEQIGTLIESSKFASLFDSRIILMILKEI